MTNECDESLGTWGKVLTGKQRKFVDFWFETNCNATKAARLAGYASEDASDNAFAAIGSRLLRNAKVIEEINQRWARHGITSQEVISRYVAQARGNIAEFLTEHGAIDWNAVRQNGHLIKRIVHRKGQQAQIELYDAQHALDMIGKNLGLWVERTDVTSGGEKLQGKVTIVLPDDGREGANS